MLLDFGISMGRTTRDPRPAHRIPADQAAHDLGDFLAEAVVPLQRSLQAAIHSLRTPCRTPAELAKHLSLDRTSAWRVWQAAFAPTAEESALSLSGETAVARFLDAVERRGGDASAVRDARHRLQHFLETVDSQIGDAATLKMILASSDSQVFDDARSMRLLHDAARLRVGAEADATLRITVRTMSQFEGLIDLASASYYGGLRTLRAGSPCLLSSRSLSVMNTAAEHPKFKTTVFTQTPLGDAAPSIPDTHTDIPPTATPVKVLDAATTLNGRHIWEMTTDTLGLTCISGGRTGKRGESSICYGDIMLASTTTLAAYDWFASGTNVCVPTETFVLELYLSQEEYDLGFTHEPRIYENIHGERAGWGTRHIGPGYPGRFEHFLPGRPRPVMPEFAVHPTILAQLDARLGVSLSDFHLFRWHMNVPIVGTSALIYSEDPIAEGANWPLNPARATPRHAE